MSDRSLRRRVEQLEKIDGTDTDPPLRVQIGGDPHSDRCDPDLEFTVEIQPPRGDSA